MRKKRCGSACVDHIVAIVHASITAVCVDVHLRVKPYRYLTRSATALGELVVHWC